MRFFRWPPVFILAITLAVTLTAPSGAAQGGSPQAGGAQTPAPPPLTMSSTAFPMAPTSPRNTRRLAIKPHPHCWTNTPPGTVTFLLHLHDMEPARNHTTEDQLHWLVWNIPGTATGLPEGVPMGQLPNGAYQKQRERPSVSRPGRPRHWSAPPLHF